MAMINTRLRAEHGIGCVRLFGAVDGQPRVCVATFTNINYFYIVTGFRTVEEYNEAQDAKPTTFLVTKRVN